MTKFLKYAWQPALLGAVLGIGGIYWNNWEFYVIMLLWVFKTEVK